MMRLYYTNPYTQNFTAQVEESLTHAGQPAVILSQTCFYPTGGGQPHDTGTLNDAAVLEVLTRPEDQAVLHVLDHALQAGQNVQGLLNWARRFDHMRQHTGQHILSRAFELVMDAATVGFHLSDNTVTIDLDRADIPQGDLDAAENLANQIVAENRAVRAWFPEADELAGLPLRKISDKIAGAVRVVAIDSFDICACGGTHVAQTGEIGIIKVVRLERSKKNTRLEFRCGERALDDYSKKNALLLGLAAELTVGYWELPEALQRLQQDNKNLQKQIKNLQSELLHYEAEALWSATEPQNGIRVIKKVWENRPTAELQGIMQHLTQKDHTLAMLGLAGEKGHLVMGCSGDVGVDVLPILKACLEKLGSQSGGGRPNLAQGGGFSATPEQLITVLSDSPLS